VRKLRGQPQQMVRLYQRLAESAREAGQAGRGVPPVCWKPIAWDRASWSPSCRWARTASAPASARGGAAPGRAGGSPRRRDLSDEVADALAQRRAVGDQAAAPERAIALYEAALRLRNGHGPSLRALADLALERGEKPQAANLPAPHGRSVERSRAARRSAGTVGDRYFELGDSTQALSAYEEALKIIGTPSESHVTLLEKALSCNARRATTRWRRARRRC